MKILFENIKNCLWNDLFNRYFVIVAAVSGIIEYFIWTKGITDNGIFVYTRLNYYPIQLLLVILILHLILSIYSYKKDEHISHLLLGALPFYSIFIFVLEMFYIYGNK
ncbi:MAG: hypothetical protein WC080_00655 [Patescibacteria group bacterium]